MRTAGINVIKVFSATRSRDRDSLGDRVTAWLRERPNLEVSRTTVTLSSDRAFHCLSIVLIGHEPHGAER